MLGINWFGFLILKLSLGCKDEAFSKLLHDMQCGIISGEGRRRN